MELFDPASTTDVLGSQLGANVSATTTSLWPVLLIAVSIPLAFYVVRSIIGLFPKSRARS